MKYRWVLRQQADDDIIDHLQQSLNNLPEALARVLAIRGVTSVEKARLFFRPEISHVHDPFLMKDMDRAVERLLRAIDTSERVLVYGDYDVDGTTSTALMVSFLRDMGLDPIYFIPHRVKHGYGLQPVGIDFAADQGATLIIALDCGITAHAEAEYVTEKGLDLVICDHHTADETVPKAVAVLNPKRRDCSYPFDGLSGCGVGFKLVQACLAQRGLPAENALKYTDLLALSIACDVVPMIDENRVLMRTGLEQIRNSPRLGLQKLAEATGQDLTTCDAGRIAFSIGPRINAAGRLADASLAVNLLLTDNEEQGRSLAEELEEINKNRRELDTGILEQAEVQAKTYGGANTLVLHAHDWHLGVVGIVASRIVDRYYRPVVMLTTVDGVAKGSARSIKGFNIYDALNACSGLLTRFGGHEYAAGLTLPVDRIDEFRSKLNAYAEPLLTDDLLSPDLQIDAHLQLGGITPRFWSVLSQIAPFGPNNKRPIFVSRDLEVTGTPTTVGRRHLKFKVRQPDSPSATSFDVIGFGMHEHLSMVRTHRQQNRPLQIVFSIDQNTWNGRTSIQLQLKDVRSQDETGITE